MARKPPLAQPLAHSVKDEAGEGIEEDIHIDEASEATKQQLDKRKALPGIASSAAGFAAWKEKAHTFSTKADQRPKLPPPNEAGMVAQTKELVEFVNANCGDWSPWQKQLTTVALGLFRMRLIDITIRDHCHVIWILAGGRLLRAEDGAARVYNSELGSWDVYRGLIPEVVLSAIEQEL